MEIIVLSGDNLPAAAEVHAKSWRESHRNICSPDFVEAHTAARQLAYLRAKQAEGSMIYLLVEDGKALGLVSRSGSLIADCYVLPDQQRKGYGSALLRQAIADCPETPRLWILETNTGAERLYERFGFRRTGKRNVHPGGVDEVEMALTDASGRPSQ